MKCFFLFKQDCETGTSDYVLQMKDSLKQIMLHFYCVITITVF